MKLNSNGQLVLEEGEAITVVLDHQLETKSPIPTTICFTNERKLEIHPRGYLGCDIRTHYAPIVIHNNNDELSVTVYSSDGIKVEEK